MNGLFVNDHVVLHYPIALAYCFFQTIRCNDIEKLTMIRLSRLDEVQAYLVVRTVMNNFPLHLFGHKVMSSGRPAIGIDIGFVHAKKAGPARAVDAEGRTVEAKNRIIL